MELAGPVGELVRASGLDFGPPPEDLYRPASPLALDSVLDMDADASEVIHRSLYAGATALKAVLPDGHPVLWSEHFDVGVSDDEVNYGVSAGDDFHPLPYASAPVGPWDFGTATRPDPFWNAPFGAVHPLEVSADPDALAQMPASRTSSAGGGSDFSGLLLPGNEPRHGGCLASSWWMTLDCRTCSNR